MTKMHTMLENRKYGQKNNLHRKNVVRQIQTLQQNRPRKRYRTTNERTRDAWKLMFRERKQNTTRLSIGKVTRSVTQNLMSKIRLRSRKRKVGENDSTLLQISLTQMKQRQ